MSWVIDSSIHGATYGEKRDWDIWITTEDDDPATIKHTIAHELAHIHAYRFYRKTKGEKIFYSHGKLHKELEAYYLAEWPKEINKLYTKLKRAKLDVFTSNEAELMMYVDTHFNKQLLAAARAI